METGGKQETTLDLDRIMDEGLATFQGELEEAARKTADDKAQDANTPSSTDADDSPPKEESAQTPAAGGRKTDGGPRGADGKAEPEAQEAPPKDDAQEKPHRFKDLEAAEDGYRHLQAAKTRAEQEAARLRAELKTAQEAEARREEQEKRDQALTDYMAEQHEKALERIDDLDPDDENYRKQVARVWAEKDTAIEGWKRQAVTSEPAASSQGQEPEGREGPDPNPLWGTVEQRAVLAGIDPTDEYFRMICTQAPSQGPDGAAMPFDQQVQWAVDHTLAYHNKQERQFQERLKAGARARAEKDQAANLPLGRSPADRSAGKSPAPQVVTLNDALNAALEERRL